MDGLLESRAKERGTKRSYPGAPLRHGPRIVRPPAWVPHPSFKLAPWSAPHKAGGPDAHGRRHTFTEQNWKRGPCPTRCMQEQVANGSVKNVFHTGTLIKTVQKYVGTCQYHKYSSTTGSNSTLVSKIVCMYTIEHSFQ